MENTFMYLIVGVIAILFIGLIVYNKMQPNKLEKRLEDLDDDDIIYDPETGASLTMQEAMEDKAFRAAGEAEGVIYDEEEAIAYVLEHLPDDLKETLTEKEVEWIVRLQGQYLLTKPDNLYDEQNIEFIQTVLANTPLRSVNKSDIAEVLKIETDYQNNLEKKE